ncbi:caspase family protein [Streptomyces xiangluensis]|uniref:Caspase family protein n=1 Tax=Streptomyces xiangluensis TaxID=2665720 RepID=A0ABV8YWS1_9ACTN
MTTSTEPPQRRHRLVLLGGHRYQSDHLDDLPSVTEDFRTVTRLFTRELRYPYEIALPRLKTYTKPDTVRRTLSTWSKRLDPDDVVTVYFSGHALPAPGRLYLALRNTDPEELVSTALPAEDLVRAVLEPGDVQHLLIILDACHAGAGAADIVKAAQALGDGAPLGSQTAQVTVLGRTGSREPADPTPAFTELLRDAVRSPASGGRQAPWLSAGSIVNYITAHMPDQELGSPILLSGIQRSECVALPNPRHTAEPEAPLPASRSRRGVRPRSRAPKRPLFLGRVTAVTAVREWHDSVSGETAGCVVTGGIGSGKSALLAHLGTPIDAHGMDVEALTRAVGEAAGLNASDPKDLVKRLPQAGHCEVWIDSLDEAADPKAVNQLLIQPILQGAGLVHHLRLLVGVRPIHVPVAPEHRRLVVVDLDNHPYRDPAALAEYAATLINADIDDPRVKAVVSEAEGTSFLVARHLAPSVAEPASEGVPSVPGAGDSLPLATALRAELERQSRRPGAPAYEDLLHLLRPLAYAGGKGMPWGHWLACASALSGSSYSDEDLQRLVDTTGDLLHEDLDGEGQSVYRPYHRALADFLRAGQAEPATATLISDALLQRVPRDPVTGRPDWSRADAYIRTHLATHAAGGRLAELIDDPDFLIAAHAPSVSRALRQSPTRPAAADAFRLAYHHLHGISSTGEQAAYLQLAALSLNQGRLARQIAERSADHNCGWKPLWAQLARPDHRLVLDTGCSRIGGLALTAVDGEPVAVTGGDDGFLKAWELIDGERKFEIKAHAHKIDEVLSAIVDGAPTVISAGPDAVRVWDLHHGRLISEFPASRGTERARIAVGNVDGRTLVASVDAYDDIWAWDPTDGGALKSFELPPQDEQNDSRWRNAVAGLVLGRAEDRTLVAAMTARGALYCWDYHTGDLVHAGDPSDRPHTFMSVAGSGASGPAALLFGDAGYPWKLWSPDLEAATPQKLPIRRPEGVSIHSSPDSTLLTAVHGGLFEVWDLARRTVVAKADFSGNYCLETALHRDGHHCFGAVAGDDGRVRVYDLSSEDRQVRDPGTERTATRAVAVGFDGARAVAAVSAGATRLVDLHSGASLLSFPRASDMVMHVRFGEADGQRVLVEADARGFVRVWDAETGQPVSDWHTGHSWSLGMAVGRLSGRGIVLTGGEGPTVPVRDLVTGEEVAQLHAEPFRQVTKLQVVHAAAQTFAVVGGNGRYASVWDLGSMQQVAQLDSDLDAGSAVVQHGEWDRMVMIDRHGCPGYVDVRTGTHERWQGPPLENLGLRTPLAVASTPYGDVALVGRDNGEISVHRKTGTSASSVRFDHPVEALDALWDHGSARILAVVGTPEGSACVSFPVDLP